LCSPENRPPPAAKKKRDILREIMIRKKKPVTEKNKRAENDQTFSALIVS